MVVIAMRVFPTPRWAALTVSPTHIGINPIIMMRKYSTAYSIESACAPENAMMGSAKV